MKILIALSLASSLTIAGFSQEISRKLNGTWKPVYEEIAGNPLPGAAFSSQEMVLADSLYTVKAESVDKGIVKYMGNKMDIYGRAGVNEGKHFRAIFKINDGQGDELSKGKPGMNENGNKGSGERLTICYNLSGDVYPEEFSTKGKAMYFMAVFVR